jgi:hypothetical protein
MPKNFIFIVAAFLFIGALPLPYGYYMLLRFIACGAFIWATYISYERNNSILPWVFAILAILFNPIIKIHFSKEIWAMIDVCSGIFLLAIKTQIQENYKRS